MERDNHNCHNDIVIGVANMEHAICTGNTIMTLMRKSFMSKKMNKFATPI